MYNKLFTKILDSTIWLAPDTHRLVWITLIAAMDQDGIVEFASVQNLAARARVSLEDTKAAVLAFESPDELDPHQEFDGRRIERIPGGWLVLNAPKYREIVSKAVKSEKSKLRVQAMRDRKKAEQLKSRFQPDQSLKSGVTQSLRSATPSDADAAQNSADQNNSNTHIGKEKEGTGEKRGNTLPALSPEQIWQAQKEKIAKAISGFPQWQDEDIAKMLPREITAPMVRAARKEIRRSTNGATQ